ncbi:hypothetical protein HYT53_00235 [Candidatus Woesearchaeota archaeon]|nr:hypothetical protein [Candidatus Woesearchaeota archaeon]
MKLNKLLTRKGILFLVIFSVLVFIGDKINFSRLVGAENQFFTLFQFFGPVAGAFLGPVVGVLAVLIAEVSSYLVAGKTLVWSYPLMINILRLLPMLFAAWYFGTKKNKLSFFVPVAAILLFIAHPVGRQVWFFALFWTIPIVIKLLPKKYGDKLFLRSLGATFTAHAVGGAMWNYIVPMTPQAWTALIPVVIYERLLFAGGIAISFIALSTLLDRLDSKTKSEYINIDKKYILFRHDA